MGVRTQAQIDQRSRARGGVTRTVVAIVALGAVGGLGARGSELITDTGEIKTTGTQVTVAAPAAALACPAAPYLTGASGSSGSGLGEFDSTQSETVSSGALALVGAGGQATFSSILRSQDTDTGAGTNSGSSAGADQGSDPDSGTDPNATTEENVVRNAAGEIVGNLDAPPPAAPEGADRDEANALLPAPITPLAGASLTRFDPDINGFAVTTTGRFAADPVTGQYTAASVGSATSNGDLRGLASATCGVPSSEQWLVGGSTSAGSSANLVVQNPSLTPATVTITLWGPSGRVELAGSDTFLVPAGSQVSTLLEGIAAEQRRVAVHVSATGALVNAYIQDHELDGVTPQGVDYVTAGAAPSRAQVIAGVRTEKTEVDAQQASFVRLAVPDFAEVESLADQSAQDAADVTAQKAGTARLYLLGKDGHVVMFGAEQIDLMAGEVQDVSLAGAPAGTYTVVIESDVPLIASARSLATGKADPSASFGGTPVDFAWVASQPVYESAQYSTQSELAKVNWVNTQFAEDLTTQSTSGLIAIPTDAHATLALALLPNAASVSELDSALVAVPNVYSAIAGADASNDETDAAAAARKAWKRMAAATVTVYSTTGSVLKELDVSFAPGGSTDLDVAALAGDGGNVGSVRVVAAEGAAVAWSVGLDDPDISGSLAALVPVQAPIEPTDLRVTRSAQVGIGG